MTLISKDVIALPEGTADHPDRGVLWNAFTRTSLRVTGQVFAALGGPDQPVIDNTLFRVWKTTCLSNAQSSLHDPTVADAITAPGAVAKR